MKHLSFLKYSAVLALGGALFMAGSVCSCANGSSIQNILGLDSEAPLYLGHRVLSATEVVFSFSKPVRVTAAHFNPPLKAVWASTESGSAEDAAGGDAINAGTNAVVITFAQEQKPGCKIIADLLVEDSEGNSLNVLTPFTARNTHIPPFRITEIRTEISKPRGEFIELRIDGDGNLAALRLFAVGQSAEEPIYEFPAVEVSEGEYVLLHLRTYPDVEAVDETGDDLSLSKPASTADTSAAKAITTDAPADARDLWIQENTELLRKTDVVYIVDQDDRPLAAVAFCADADKWNKNENFQAALTMLTTKGAWRGEPFNSAKTTTTRTISRYESEPDTKSAADWFIRASGNTNNCTPGKPNILP